MRNGRSEWPQWLYHPKFDALLVKDQKHADKIAPEEDGWRDSPYSDEEKAEFKMPKKLKAVADAPEETDEIMDPKPEAPVRTKGMSTNAFNKANIQYKKDLEAWKDRNPDAEA